MRTLRRIKNSVIYNYIKISITITLLIISLLIYQNYIDQILSIELPLLILSSLNLNPPLTLTRKNANPKEFISEDFMYHSENSINNGQNAVGQNVLIHGKDLAGQDPGIEVQKRRTYIETMIRDAWNDYFKYAWGYNEVRPKKKCRYNSSRGIFGPSAKKYRAVQNNGEIGVQIIDALDLLYIAGFDDEYRAGLKWIENSLDFGKLNDETPLSKLNLHVLGGLLSLYSLTGEEIFKKKSLELGNFIVARLNFKSQKNDAMILLGELGSYQLEFTYLSEISGIKSFKAKSDEIQKFIKDLPKPKGLYDNIIRLNNNKKLKTEDLEQVSVGQKGKCFYEYLIKAFIQSGNEDTDSRDIFDEAMDSLEQFGLIKSTTMIQNKTTSSKTTTTIKPDKNSAADDEDSSPEDENDIPFNPNSTFDNYYYFTEMHMGQINNAMDVQACALGGVLTLAAASGISNSNSPKGDKNMRRIMKHMRIGEEIVRTCHQSTLNSYTRLGAEKFYFTPTKANETKNEGPGPKLLLSSISTISSLKKTKVRDSDNSFRFRPEIVESYFILWRLTQENKYREMAWEYARAMENIVKVRAQGGYYEIRDVYQKLGSIKYYDLQPTWLLSGTLKYLYLIFSSSHLISIDEWIANSVGHFLPIKNANMYYREYKGSEENI